MRRRQRGFTLLEVLVALTVVAIAMAALVEAGAQQAASRGQVRDQTRAAWVAANALETLRLRETWPSVGERSGQALMGDQTWYWRLTISQTEEPRMRRIDAEVYPADGAELPVATMSGFVGRIP
ncbi:MAG: type II secretion system minor pseudopilin GspI [Xanthomonadales bacterium]|nr:type II secretion system minor pseudopilin GspI [Xanthomonadales bacterium]